MTTPTDNTAPDSPEEDLPTYAIQTPFGIVTDGKDLPPALQSALRAQLEAGRFPEPIAGAVRRFLGDDGFDALVRRFLGEDAIETPLEDIAGAPAQPAVATATDQVSECTCGETHRLQVWDILDEAFPREPHLWQAVAALFSLSAANPTTADGAARRAALETADQHLKRSLSRLDSPLSLEDELVERFKGQMGDS
jgi:hypothetical protein